MRIWRYFYTKGTPEYLAKHYWWAYIWKRSIWFFDLQPIISAILFGHYQSLLNKTLAIIDKNENKRLLQIACVYGKLTPCIAQNNSRGEFHVIDIAGIQLNTTREKLKALRPKQSNHYLVKMNAEHLAYANDSFETVLIFFLLHEMPADARFRTLTEAIRVLSPNGRLIIVEYGELTDKHIFHRLFLTRYVLGAMEPFLLDFWQENLKKTVKHCAQQVGKSVSEYAEIKEFSNFYRVVELQVIKQVTA